VGEQDGVDPAGEEDGPGAEPVGGLEDVAVPLPELRGGESAHRDEGEQRESGEEEDQVGGEVSRVVQ
jgi:hypothetical protein